MRAGSAASRGQSISRGSPDRQTSGVAAQVGDPVRHRVDKPPAQCYGARLMDRSEEIRRRHAAHNPLNLSAVQREAPHLLEGLWEPENFIGWRRTVETAGIPIDRIRVFAAIETACPLCGWSAPRLVGHLGPAHGMTIADIRKTRPEAEEVCEEARAARMGVKKNRKALSLAPHWEPAWSKWYALDRLRWFYDQGMPVNYAAVAKGEPGMAAYLRRVMGSWGHALKAVGLKPEDIRLNAETRTWSRRQMVAELRRMARQCPHRLSLDYARSGTTVTFFRAVLREFKSYEGALTEAKLDPLAFIPALADPEKTAKRGTLLALAAERILKRRPYQAAETAAFLREWQGTVDDFYGSWVSLADVLGVDERDIFNPPPWTFYARPEAVIAALKERREAGLSVREHEVRPDNSPLLMQGKKVFGSWNAALAAAGLKRPPRALHLRKYTPESLLETLKERHRQGLTMNSFTILQERTDVLLLKWAGRYYGSWLKALAAAGIPPVERAKPVRKVPQPPVPLEKYLDLIRARAAAGLSLRAYHMNKPRDQGGHPGLVAVCRKRFGSWDKALAAAGLSEPPHATTRRPYRTREEVIEVLRHRHEAGLPLTASAMRRGPDSNSALMQAIGRLYPDVRSALEDAGVPVPPSLIPGGLRRYQTKEDIRADLQRRHAAGESLSINALILTPFGQTLYRSASRLSGGWNAALKDAGFGPNPIPGRPKPADGQHG